MKRSEIRKALEAWFDIERYEATGKLTLISEKEPETAMNILSDNIYSEILYDVLIAHEVEACGKGEEYKDLSDINFGELKETILHWHKEHIIALVLKNIKPDDTDGPVYWQLKMTVNRH